VSKLQEIIDNYKQKSPQQRFLFILGFLFLIVYIILGLAIIFWDKLPFNLVQWQRYAFGTLLIVYAFIRFNRLLK
jgi:cytochrome c biogenesis protein CcdA